MASLFDAIVSVNLCFLLQNDILIKEITHGRLL